MPSPNNSGKAATPKPIYLRQSGKFEVRYLTSAGKQVARAYDTEDKAAQVRRDAWKAFINGDTPAAQRSRERGFGDDPGPYELVKLEALASRTPASPAIGIADLPPLGAMIQVAGLVLADDSTPLVMLRIGEKTWTVSIEART